MTTRLFLAVLTALIVSNLFATPVQAKRIVDPAPPKESDASWSSTSGENPEFRPLWLVTCDFTVMRYAPGYEYGIDGSLPEGTRVLASEVSSNGWAWLYVQKAWVRSRALCTTWQPEGWQTP